MPSKLFPSYSESRRAAQDSSEEDEDDEEETETDHKNEHEHEHELDQGHSNSDSNALRSSSSVPAGSPPLSMQSKLLLRRRNVYVPSIFSLSLRV
jgi:hypothetical protein